MSSISLLSKGGAKRAWTLLCERMMEQRSKTSISFFTRAAMTLLLAVMTTLTASAQTAPVGSVEVVGGPDYISVRGWAYDPSDEWENVTVYVQVYDDEECTNRVAVDHYSAELPTTGVAELQSIEGDHGFEGVFWLGNGDYWVKFIVDTDDGPVQLSITPVHVKYLFCGHYVNASNVTDIFGDSSASFDNSTNTLTLNNSSGMEPNVGVLIDADFDLTIKGSWHMTQQQLNGWSSDIVHAVRCSGSLTFDGDFTLLSETDHPTLVADGGITLHSGTLAIGSKDHYALQCGGGLVMESGFSRLELKNSMTAPSLTLPDGLSIVTPAGGTFDEPLQTIVESDGTTPATHILIATEAGAAQTNAELDNWVTSWDPSLLGCFLWLGNTPVTTDNKDDILNDGGKARFDPDTYTLTLNEPTISGSYKNALIYVDKADLTITGTYHKAWGETTYGVCMENGTSLTLDGDFTFSAIYALHSFQDITIRSGKVEANSNHDNAITCWGNLIIADGVDYVEVQAPYECCMHSNGLSLPSNYGIAIPVGGIFQNGYFYESDGTTKAHHVVIQNANYANPTSFRVSSTFWEATIEWDAPTTNFEILGYAYMYRKAGDAEWSEEATVNSNTTSVTFTGLTRETNYEFCVKTVYSSNRKWYASFSFTTPPPKEPTNLAASNVYYANATLEWEAPVEEYPITGYAYQYKEAGDTEWSAEVLTTATSVTIPGLSPGTDYDFRVKAIYSVGESSFVPVSFTTLSIIYSYQDFESGMNGWTVVNPDSQTRLVREVSHSGDYSFVLCAKEDIQYLVSPEFDGETELCMSFYIYPGATPPYNNQSYRLGYSTTTTDFDAFKWTSESYQINSADWYYIEWNGCPLGTKYYAILPMKTYGYVCVDDICFTSPVALIDDYDNSTTITTYADGQTYNAKLHGRTLYRDGDWNTLCLPFDVTDGDADDGISFSRTPLEGATVMTLGSSDFTDGTLTLNFTEATSIEAGRPYIVKWPDGASLTINSDADWLSFAQRVEAGETFAGKNVLLGADINVSTMVGSADHPFCGTFDGAGHTLNLSIDAPGVLCAAPFRYISNATIRNIVTTGSVHGGQHSAGLVGAATGSTNSIRDCLMAATVTTTQQYIGGILGHGTTSATTISNCYLTGSLTAKNVGIFYGWGDNGTHTVADCWAMGDYDATGDLNLLLSNGGTTSVTNCNRNINDDRVTQGNYTLIVFSYSPVTELLGSQWSLDGDGHVTLSPTAGVLTPELRNPLFRNAVFSDAEPTAVTSQDGRVKFVGNYDPFVIDDSNIDEIIYLGTNNIIGYASASRTLRSFRAHFVVSAGSASHAAIRQVLLNDGTSTAVIPIAADVKDAAADDSWYTIQGVKLKGMPTEKGLYIHNGSKVSIK